MDKTNDPELEKTLTRALGKPHRWVKKVDEYGIMYKYLNNSSAMTSVPGQMHHMPPPEPPKPVGQTSTGQDIFQWVCEECSATTYSDDPAFGECKGAPVEPQWANALYKTYPKVINYSQLIAQNTNPYGYQVTYLNTPLRQTPIASTKNFVTLAAPSTMASSSTGWKTRLKKWMTHNPFVQKEKEPDERKPA